ncbi:MAG: hypothetical protein IJX63_13830 [Lachnospiraceae bacterium]|nr:hypothetical protein [Lachnospiraceae bacterium]
MKTLKKLFYGLCICILLVCIAILVVAMNPEWSKKLAEALYGEGGVIAEETPEPTQEPENTDEGTEQIVPHTTPLVYATEVPAQVGDENDTVKEDAYEPKTIDIKMVCPPISQITSYVKPTGTQEIPETVGSLCGLAELTATMTEVTDEEVTKLQESLSEGYTGALLVFEQEYYPYYHMLSDDKKDLYRQIYANAYAMNGAFKPCVEIFATHLGEVVEAVYLDNPVLYWMEPAFTCKYGKDGMVTEIALQYNETAQKPKQAQFKFEEAVEEILRGARNLDSDYAKEKYVHDELAKSVTYATDATMNQSAYSALVNGKTVCAGYTRAYQYLLQQLGIPCYYCRGYSGEKHAWNIVKLYGEYYNVDVTWDDTSNLTYDYFNKTDADLAKTHVRRGLSVNLPACTGTLYGGLEPNENGQNSGVAAGIYSEGLALYYDQLCDRITALRRGRADYSDILDAEVWKELEEAYSNGNQEFRDDYLIRALQTVGADYCIVSLSAEKITDKAFEVNCSVLVE